MFWQKDEKQRDQILTLPSLSTILCERVCSSRSDLDLSSGTNPRLPKPTHARNFAQSQHDIELKKYQKKSFVALRMRQKSARHWRGDMTSRCLKIFRFGAVELRFDRVTRFLEPDPNSSTHLYRRKALGTHNTQKLEAVVDASPSDDEQIQHYKRRNFRREFNFIAFA